MRLEVAVAGHYFCECPPILTRSRRRFGSLRSPAGGLLDSDAEPAFDRLTQLVTQVLGVPVALISLVDHERQFFKSQCGLPEPWAGRRETPLSHSFCQHVVASREPLLVTDARENALVRHNLAIPDLGVIAYAGVPVVDADGFVLGSLCAIDNRPREWSDADVLLLRALSAAGECRVAVTGAHATTQCRTGIAGGTLR